MHKKKLKPSEFYSRCMVHGLSNSIITENVPIATETSENSDVGSIRDITKIGRQNDAEQVVIDESNSKPFTHDKSPISDEMQSTLNS